MFIEQTITPCKGFQDPRIEDIRNNLFGYLPTVHTRHYNIFTHPSRILDTSKVKKPSIFLEERRVLHWKKRRPTVISRKAGEYYEQLISLPIDQRDKGGMVASYGI